MAKNKSHTDIDAILAMPLKKKGQDEEEPEVPDEEEDGDGEAETEALDELADVLDVPEDKREAFHEALRKVIETCRG